MPVSSTNNKPSAPMAVHMSVMGRPAGDTASVHVLPSPCASGPSAPPTQTSVMLVPVTAVRSTVGPCGNTTNAVPADSITVPPFPTTHAFSSDETQTAVGAPIDAGTATGDQVLPS